MKNTKLIQAALRVVKTRPEFKQALRTELQKKAERPDPDGFSIDAGIERALYDILRELADFFYKKHPGLSFGGIRKSMWREWQIGADIKGSDAQLFLHVGWIAKKPEVRMVMYGHTKGSDFSVQYPFGVEDYPHQVVTNAGIRLNKDLDDWIYKHSS
jgi:hypothetical protein